MTITDNTTRTEHFDVIIVGAGLSGVGSAYRLQTECPGKSYTILESRAASGGTWDLFRYPGVRSDSDMFTLGYPFHPWPNPKAIADGPSILNYIRETAREYGIDRKIRYNHKVRRAAWSSEEARWTVEVEDTASSISHSLSCNFLFMCSGYYDYSQGYLPEWPDFEKYRGQVIHPQFWPEDLNYTGKRVVIIGSGATAVTLAPAMAPQAAHVTMLQRSPTYIVSMPARDAIANWLREHLPKKIAYSITRWKQILISMLFYMLARKRPEATKKRIIQMAQQALGPDYNVERHFSPLYNPWDQRLCLVPDADLFNAIKEGKVSVVTDQIESFTEKGILLKSGEQLEADIIVTATGLSMKVGGGVEFVVDGQPVKFSSTLSYKGTMYSDIPNLASVFGYTNASWTLKADLIAQYVCRVLNYMDEHGYNVCAPRRPTEPGALSEEPILNLTSGYVQRAITTLPHQGSKAPWKLYQNYLQDVKLLKLSRVNDGTLQFQKVNVGKELAHR
ncbi:MAG TPA: NAD(P)/FAD-dependent oxidoreductase [Chloroflexia bacterium]|nr:NAD(P)/FAD-dependent oxidoreductase [Chloroflexia bacterium]